MEEMARVYQHRAVEEKWYRWWEESGFFHQDADPQRMPFSVVMPPPNVTGSLHLGHALDNTMQDILTRYKRMQGYNTLWLPGTDHAGIATQAKVEEQLAREGLTKEDLGREEFLNRVWDWKKQYGGKIVQQLRLLGSSCDWARERFTMDDGCSRAVRETFVDLYRRGLIYRGNYIINWCPKCSTTISDIEVEHREVTGGLWEISYPLSDGSGAIVVATTRPETMLGDTAVAVHPTDARYQGAVGKTVLLPLVGREIPVVADEYVDPEFGSGAVKITPAHDPNDFEVARRHDLPSIVVIGQDGKMTAAAGSRYAGMDRNQCREVILKDLEAAGVLVSAKEYSHMVGHCYRCNTVIEPLVSRQWFVKMKPLAEPALEAVRQGRIRFVPERFTKIYEDWLVNIRDWCISRQLWWGHRIPVWYCRECGAEIASTTDPAACPECGGRFLEQDPDVLDTWFSSALWPFSTMGWPGETRELEHFFPTSVLVTGRDIIFFWVARMIFMALAEAGEVPFREVLIHGLVLDSQGRKMSKSLGNGVDPIEVIEEYGADSLRFMLVTGNTPGNDLKFQAERLEASRNFTNKIWNASRFVIMNLTDDQDDTGENLELSLADRWILSRYNSVVREVTANLKKYELGEAARHLYDFLWSEFCDWYIEVSKIRLYGDEPQARRTAQKVLVYVLRHTLELLHPFMPFITEEIWQRLPHQGDTIMLAPWPAAIEELNRPDAEAKMAVAMEVTRAVRNIRAEMGIPPGTEIEVIAVPREIEAQKALEETRSEIQFLARAKSIAVEPGLVEAPRQAAAAVAGGIKLYVPLKGVIDLEKELERLEKTVLKLERELNQVETKLANQHFVQKAPADVVEREQNRRSQLEGEISALRERLRLLKE